MNEQINLSPHSPNRLRYRKNRSTMKLFSQETREQRKISLVATLSPKRENLESETTF
jgi:hypothetical protein